MTGTQPMDGRRAPALHAALGTVVLAVLAGMAWYGFEAAVTTPIEKVAFTGELERVSRGDLERLAASVRGLRSGAETLEAIREAARRVAWVREATVRRRFPDGIEVRIDSHEVLARWNEATLVSTRGELFSADHAGALARFEGPEAAVRDMAREYPRLAALLGPLGSPVAELRYSARGAWQVALESGLVLDIGRSDIHARIERFVAAWPKLAAGPAAVRADLRYPNGFALRREAAPARKS